MNSFKTRQCISDLYYGEEHFLVKTIKFLREGIKQNEKCFCYLDTNLITTVMNHCKRLNLNSDQIKFNSVEDLMNEINNFNEKESTNNLKQNIVTLQKEAMESGQANIRFLIHTRLIVTELDKDDYVVLHQSLSKIINQLDISCLLMYDAANLIDNKIEEDTTSEFIAERILSS